MSTNFLEIWYDGHVSGLAIIHNGTIFHGEPNLSVGSDDIKEIETAIRDGRGSIPELHLSWRIRGLEEFRGKNLFKEIADLLAIADEMESKESTMPRL